MKVNLETVTYRVTPEKKVSFSKMRKLQKDLNKVLPNALYLSFSNDPDRKDDLMIFSCKTISKSKLEEFLR